MRLTPAEKQIYRDFLENCQAKEGDMYAIRKTAEATIRLSERITPQYLYRYRAPSEYAFNDLENGTLTFAHPASFEDVEDAVPIYNLDPLDETLAFMDNPDNIAQLRKDSNLRVIEEVMRKIKLMPPEDAMEHFASDDPAQLSTELTRAACELKKHTVPKVIECLNNSRRNSVRIACLTDNPSNPYMWEAYAANHSGFMLAYDTNIIRSCNLSHNTWVSLLPILYDEEPFGSDNDLQWGVLSAIGADIIHDDVFTAYRAIFRKHPRFEQEEEWRAAILLKPEDKEGTHIQRPCPASAIICGNNISTDNELRCANAAKKLGIPILSEAEFDALLESGIRKLNP